MENGEKWLEAVAGRMKQEFEHGNVPTPEEITARDLIGKFGWERRYARIVNHVQNLLMKLSLQTIPDFKEINDIDIDHLICIRLNPGVHEREKLEQTDPTLRVGTLKGANKELSVVNPNNPLSVAEAKMVVADYSQLPVMQGEYRLEGVITWQSISEHRLHGRHCEYVRDCMVQPQEVSSEEPLVNAIDTIMHHGYVLVRGTNGAIIDIITASDLSAKFMAVAGPFIFIRQIEGHLRRLIKWKFTVEELRSAAHPPEAAKRVNGPNDLTFGDYCQLLGISENWQRLHLNMDRAVFVDGLKSVRDLRNDVMHFRTDSEGLDDDAIKPLRDLARFLENG